jgi:hypothetical protein
MAIPCVALPPLNNVVNLPPRPQNPPVPRDITVGYKYTKDIVIAYGKVQSHCSDAVSAHWYVGS